MAEEEQRLIWENWIRLAKWGKPSGFPGLLELKAANGRLLAWIQERPNYCDRGHYQGQIEFSPGNPLDFADGGIHYYMRLETAKQELREKLLWRVCKIRAE
jgi:hypothetical protein